MPAWRNRREQSDNKNNNKNSLSELDHLSHTWVKDWQMHNTQASVHQKQWHICSLWQVLSSNRANAEIHIATLNARTRNVANKVLLVITTTRTNDTDTQWHDSTSFASNPQRQSACASYKHNDRGRKHLSITHYTACAKKQNKKKGKLPQTARFCNPILTSLLFFANECSSPQNVSSK